MMISSQYDHGDTIESHDPSPEHLARARSGPRREAAGAERWPKTQLRSEAPTAAARAAIPFMAARRCKRNASCSLNSRALAEVEDVIRAMTAAAAAAVTAAAVTNRP